MRNSLPDSPLDFILQRSVFRLDELEAVYEKVESRPKSISRTLEPHLASGRIVAVRRGVYVHSGWVNPWLLASKLAADVVISHDGALSFHGLTGVGHQVSFLTAARTSIVRHAEVIYRPLQVPKVPVENEQHDREGQPIWVTPVPHALVDCLAFLDRGPPLDELMEIFRSLARTADPSRMIRYAKTFKSPLLMSRLAYFLTCTRYDLSIHDLQVLNGATAQTPTHFRRSERSREDSLIRKWNLIVSPELYAFWPRHH